MIANLILKIKRKETPLYAVLYSMGKFFYSFNLPAIKLIHLPLYYLDRFVKVISGRLVRAIWHLPLFKARCEKVGKNLRLPNGIPFIIGGHLKIYLGDNVSIGRSTIGASKVFDHPVLKIGNKTSIGYGTTISVAKEVIIGDDCMISANCLIMDSDDHPISPEKRLLKLPVGQDDVKPVRIGNNVWVGAYSAILKGVTIGDNSIIGTHSVVTNEVPANSIYGGVPAKAIR